jgi:signal transduction histidine kinase
MGGLSMDSNSCTQDVSELRISSNRVIDVNYTFLEMTGYKKKEVIGKSLQEIKALLKSEFTLNPMNSSGDIGENFIFSKKLCPKHVNIYTKLDENNGDQIILFEKHLDNKLKENINDNIFNLLNIMDLPIVRISYPDLKIISVNDRVLKGAKKYFNITEISSIIGKNINSLVPEFISSLHSEYFFLMERNQESVNVNNCKIALPGRTYYFNSIYQPLLDAENKIKEILVIMMDVTHEIQNKMDLEKVLQTQEEFFSYIAHEFKTPLTVTYSALQLLDYFCEEELSERAKRFINKIRQSSLQQLRLVNNLLDITKADSGYLKLNRKSFDIVFMTVAIVNSVLTISKEKGIDIIFSSSVSERNILIDDEKYERIILNILSNAIKFTPSGKSIYVNIFIENNYVNVRIKDEGAGIPLDKQEIIFDRFGQVNNGLTRSGEGTGIGLCLAKMLAKALGGDITLMSELGIGSEFTIQIPDVAASNISFEKPTHDALEDRLIQSVNVEFSSIYQ